MAHHFLHYAGNVEASKKEDGVLQLGPALPDKHASKKQVYIQASQGLFPSPIHPDKLAGGNFPQLLV